MSELKTKQTDASVDAYLESLSDPRQREDARAIVVLMSDVSGEPPRMWGESIVGFGTYHYRYASGREGNWMRIGFSPRKQNLTIYLSSGIEQHQDLLDQLGKHKTGKGCLYIKRLADVDQVMLRQLVERSIEETSSTE